MSHSAVLVVFVLAAEVADPTTLALADAAREALGEGAKVSVEAMSPATGSQSAEDARARSKAGAATGVLELSWSASHTRAALHVYVSKEQRWVDRSIAFSAADDATERGRTLGFAVAGMLLGPDSPPRQASAPSPSEPAPGPPHPEQPPRQAPPVAGTPPEPRNLRYAVGLSAIATSGIQGSASGFGAGADLRFQAAPVLAMRVAAGATFGDVPAAQSTLRIVTAAGGVAVQILGREPDSEWGLGARADVGAVWLQATHLSEDDPEPVSERRWLLMGDALLEGSRALSESILLVGASGVQGTSGRTFIYTHGERSATVPLFKLLLELGVRARF